MKILNILSASPKAITGLCQSIAKQSVSGLKAKTSTLIKALAQDEGLSPEAFLKSVQKHHESAYKILSQRASFDKCNETYKLASIDYQVFINGWSISQLDTLKAMGGIYENDGYTQDIRLFIGVSGFPKGAKYDTKILQNYQLALGHIIEVINDINSRKRNLAPETLSKEGWEVSVNAVNSLTPDAEQCPNCKEFDIHKKNPLFTYPFQNTPHGLAEFKVCQHCGRSTWLEDGITQRLLKRLLIINKSTL